MNNSRKKLEVLFCFFAGIGLFLSLIDISAYGESASVSFMDLFDNNGTINGIINAKIILALLIIAFTTLLVRLREDGKNIKIISISLVLVSGILFGIDIYKLSVMKRLLSSMLHYGVGYYVTLISIVATFILGLNDLFSKTTDSLELEKIIDNHQMNNQKENIKSNQEKSKENNQLPPSANPIKLSDLANKTRSNSK